MVVLTPREEIVMRFVSEAIEPDGGTFDPTIMSQGLPNLPAGFSWRGRHLIVTSTIRTWRSTREDRGEAYLDRLWFEFLSDDGARAVVYFDKHAKRRADRWRLYTIDEP
jgi:hypothetical protein